MGRLSGLKEGDAMTADVSDDRAEAGEVLVLMAGPEEEEDEIDVPVFPLETVRPPPDCCSVMLKAAGT